MRDFEGMYRTVMPLVLLGTLAGSAAFAREPLCRDLKGLYTPCPPGVAPQPAASRRIRPAIAAAVARNTGVMQANYSRGGADLAPDVVVPRAPPPVIARAMNLCRTMKGAYTPCQQ